MLHLQSRTYYSQRRGAKTSIHGKILGGGGGGLQPPQPPWFLHIKVEIKGKGGNNES